MTRSKVMLKTMIQRRLRLRCIQVEHKRTSLEYKA